MSESIVHFKYPDQSNYSSVRVENGPASASTAMEQLPGPCAQNYDVTFNVKYTSISGNCAERNNVQTRRILGPFTGPHDRVIGNQWVVVADRYNVSGQKISTVNWFGACGVNSNNSHRPASSLISVVPVGTPSTNCGASKCRFTVTDANGATVFSELNDVCPTWHVSDGCPPDTLECGDCCLDCGDYLGDVRSLVSQLKQLAGSPVIHQ